MLIIQGSLTAILCVAIISMLASCRNNEGQTVDPDYMPDIDTLLVNLKRQTAGPHDSLSELIVADAERELDIEALLMSWFSDKVASSQCISDLLRFYSDLDLAGRANTTEWMPGFSVIPLREALSLTQELKSNTPWSPNWLPLLQGAGPELYAIELEKEACFIRHVNLHPWTVGAVEFSSLRDWLARLLERYSAGEYRLDSEGMLRRVVSAGRGGQDGQKQVELENLFALMRSEDGVVRGQAAEQLIRLAEPDSISGVIELLDSTRPNTRELAIRVLSELGVTLDSETVVELMNDRDVGVRISIAESIPVLERENMEGEVIEAVQNESDLTVKRKLVWSLGEIGGQESASFLGSLESSKPIEYSVEMALRRLEVRGIISVGE